MGYTDVSDSESSFVSNYNARKIFFPIGRSGERIPTNPTIYTT
jgi:hypothetical protein